MTSNPYETIYSSIIIYRQSLIFIYLNFRLNKPVPPCVRENFPTRCSVWDEKLEAFEIPRPMKSLETEDKWMRGIQFNEILCRPWVVIYVSIVSDLFSKNLLETSVEKLIFNVMMKLMNNWQRWNLLLTDCC